MSRISAEEILQLCAARFDISVEDVRKAKDPGWRDKFPPLRPSRVERAQYAAVYLIDRHTITHPVVFRSVMGFHRQCDYDNMVHRAKKEIRAFNFDVARIEQSIDRIHELRISIEDAQYGHSQMPPLRGKVYG